MLPLVARPRGLGVEGLEARCQDSNRSLRKRGHLYLLFCLTSGKSTFNMGVIDMNNSFPELLVLTARASHQAYKSEACRGQCTRVE